MWYKDNQLKLIKGEYAGRANINQSNSLNKTADKSFKK
jgi:hypothetical protein